MFAKRDIPPETFISFYHGILYLPGQNADTECTGTNVINILVEIEINFIVTTIEGVGLLAA